MSKPLIIIADQDINYLETLEYKFLESLGDKIELELISNIDYFNSFFAESKTAEIAVISEKMFSRELLKHNINHIFVLTEEETSGGTSELSINYIYKYTGIKEIFNELIYRSRDKFLGGDANKDAEIIALYSPVGGSGKTALSLGLAKSLVENHKRVLYINTESIQAFAYYLENKDSMTTEGYRAIRNDDKNIYRNIKPFIRKENFAYVPPMGATLDALNLNSGMFINLIESAKASKEFDYIVVDIEAGYSRTRVELLQQADKVLMVMLQDALSFSKMEYILNNIDVLDREKYLFICNKFKEDEPNAYVDSDMQKKFPLTEYIEYSKDGLEDIDTVAQLNGIQKLAYMFI